MGQLVGCVRGISAACKALDFPVVSGNVSLYNETNGRAILPTPTIGGVGVLADFTKSASLAFKSEGDAIILIGTTQGWLGQSMYLREICGREEGAPPPVDLALEKRHGEFVRKLIGEGRVSAVHDIADGGLAVALAEMAMASGRGATLDAADGIAPHAFWFGEDQARYILTATHDNLAAVIEAARVAGVAATRIGTVGGNALTFSDEKAIPVAELSARFESWLPDFMVGEL
jgi:phosphoribosylformylglycinamidine (FGAM) synthase-like enzyme